MKNNIDWPNGQTSAYSSFSCCRGCRNQDHFWNFPSNLSQTILSILQMQLILMLLIKLNLSHYTAKPQLKTRCSFLINSHSRSKLITPSLLHKNYIMIWKVPIRSSRNFVICLILTSHIISQNNYCNLLLLFLKYFNLSFHFPKKIL